MIVWVIVWVVANGTQKADFKELDASLDLYNGANAQSKVDASAVPALTTVVLRQRAGALVLYRLYSLMQALAHMHSNATNEWQCSGCSTF